MHWIFVYLCLSGPTGKEYKKFAVPASQALVQRPWCYLFIRLWWHFQSCSNPLNVFIGDLSLPCLRFFVVAENYIISNNMYIMTCWNVLVERKQYLVMIRFLISMSNLTFLDYYNFCQVVSSNINVKNDIF